MVATAYSVEANQLFIRSENPDGEALGKKMGAPCPMQQSRTPHAIPLTLHVLLILPL
jgi:hypothetical protein